MAEAGGLCESCSPIPFRKPVRRQTTAKTPEGQDGDAYCRQAGPPLGPQGEDGCRSWGWPPSAERFREFFNESVRIGLLVVFVLWVRSVPGLALQWLVGDPVVWVEAITGYVVWLLWEAFGPFAVALAAGILAAALLAWRLAHPGSFRPWVAWPGPRVAAAPGRRINASGSR